MRRWNIYAMMYCDGFVWRVENAAGVGPYRTAEYGGIGEILTQHGFNTELDPLRPIPAADDGLAVYFNSMAEETRAEYVYGYASLSDYMSWFDTPEIRAILKARDFFLTLYKVAPDGTVHYGTHQAMFRIGNASVLAFKECDTLMAVSLQDPDQPPDPMAKMLEFRPKRKFDPGLCNAAPRKILGL